MARAFVDMARTRGPRGAGQQWQVIGLAADVVFVPADIGDYASYRRFFQERAAAAAVERM